MISGLASAQMMITEIMYNPPESGGDSLEFIEFTNASLAPVNLNGWAVTEGVDYTFGNITVLPAGTVVICVDSVAMQNVFSVAAYQWTSGALGNGGEDIVLKDNFGTTIDSVDYDDGAPWPVEPDGNGPSLVFCDPLLDNNDPANWMVSTDSTGVIINSIEVIASPGTIDQACSTMVVPPSTPEYAIADINNVDMNGEADSLGVVCWTRGVVLGVDLRGGNGLQFTIWDQEGIGVFSFDDLDNYVVTQGDSILIRGVIGQFNGLTQINPDSISLLNSGNVVPNPSLVTSLGESDESEPRRIENFWVFDIDNFGNHTLVNGNDTVVMRVDTDTDVDDSVSFAIGDTLCYVNGIGGQRDTQSPYDEGYQLFPMFPSDVDNSCGSIIIPPVVIPEYPIADINNDDANGEPDSLGVVCWTRGVVLGIDFDGNNGLSFTLWDQEGINIFNFNDVSNYVVTEGDSIRVRGEIDFFRGLTEVFVDSIQVLSTGNPLPMPMVVDVPGQNTESEPIQVNGLTFIANNGNVAWPTGGMLGGSVNLPMLNCNGDTVTMRVDSDTELNGTFPTDSTATYDITGIGGQFDETSPYLQGYQIFPVYTGDLSPVMTPTAPTLLINELMSDNTSTIEDANGDFDDWVELYNTGSNPVPLGGLYVTNDANELDKYMIPMGSAESVAAGGYELVWCDDEDSEGDLHTNFELSASGDFFAISYLAGCDVMIIDSVTFGALDSNQSFGRETDGGTPWVTFGIATPDAMNEVLAIDENGAVSEELKAWPNPVNTTLSFSRPVSFVMYNMTGQVVSSQERVIEVDVRDLSDGLYILQTNDGHTLRVVVE